MARETVQPEEDSTPLIEEAIISPVLGPGGTVTHYVKVARDVTYVVDLEARYQQAQKMEAVGRLAGGVAHDFNNILTVISGYSEILADELGKSGAWRDELGAIIDAAAPGRDADRAAPDIQQEAEARAAGDRPELGREGHRDDASAPDRGGHFPSNGACDATRPDLRGPGPGRAGDTQPRGERPGRHAKRWAARAAHVAWHWTRALHGARPDAAPGEYAILDVSDTGTGMTEEVKAHLFEPFFTTKPEHKGTGLGLATVYGIVTQSGGFIEVSSALGEGTRFQIYFPVTQEAAARQKTRDGGRCRLVGQRECASSR